MNTFQVLLKQSKTTGMVTFVTCYTAYADSYSDSDQVRLRAAYQMLCESDKRLVTAWLNSVSGQPY